MNTPQQSASPKADNITKQVAKFQERRQRSRYAACAFIVLAAIFIVTLIVTRGNPPGFVGIPFGLVLVWTIVESAMLANSVCLSKNGAFLVPFGGIFTYGIVSVIAIFILRHKDIKELAIAKLNDQQLREMLTKPASWRLAALEDAKAELQRRKTAALVSSSGLNDKPNGNDQANMSDLEVAPLPDKIDVGDVVMALVGFGIPFGIIALIKGQPKRGMTIFAISAVMIILMVVSNMNK